MHAGIDSGGKASGMQLPVVLICVFDEVLAQGALRVGRAPWPELRTCRLADRVG